MTKMEVIVPASVLRLGTSSEEEVNQHDNFSLFLIAMGTGLENVDSL